MPADASYRILFYFPFASSNIICPICPLSWISEPWDMGEICDFIWFVPNRQFFAGSFSNKFFSSSGYCSEGNCIIHFKKKIAPTRNLENGKSLTPNTLLTCLRTQTSTLSRELHKNVDQHESFKKPAIRHFDSSWFSRAMHNFAMDSGYIHAFRSVEERMAFHLSSMHNGLMRFAVGCGFPPRKQRGRSSRPASTRMRLRAP